MQYLLLVREGLMEDVIRHMVGATMRQKGHKARVEAREGAEEVKLTL